MNRSLAVSSHVLPTVGNERSAENWAQTTAFHFHHIGIAVKDLAAAIPAYRQIFGYELISGPFQDPIQGVTVCFLTQGVGDPMLELVAPLAVGSPVMGKVRQGGGPYHICYEVGDLNSAISDLTAQGSLLLSGPVPAVAFEGRQIAWIMTDVHLLVELLQAQE